MSEKHHSFFNENISLHHLSHSLYPSNSTNELFELVRTDNVQHLATIKDVRWNITDDTGATLLHVAVKTSSLQSFQWLLNNTTISVNAQDNNGDTPLHIAMMTGSPQAMTMLLEAGADDTISNCNYEPPLSLLLRSQDNCIEQLSVFLRHSVHVNVKGANGDTVLHTIAELDKVEALELIWPAITEENDELFPQNANGRTPLHVAASRLSHKTLDLMISKAVQLATDSDSVIHLLDDHSNTPLHTAVEHNHIASVEVLLKHGASPTILNRDTPPACHLACQQDRMDIVVAMVKHCGAEILASRDDCGATPLHYCTKSVCDELFSFAVTSGADVNSVDNEGNTPLHKAVTQGGAWRAEFLIGKGADPLIMNKKGYNPFHLSLRYPQGEVFRAFMSSSHIHTLCTTPDVRGDFPLHIALKQKCTLALPLIMATISTDDFTSYKDSQGNTILHAAAAAGDTTNLTLLLSFPTTKRFLNGLNSEGMTPLHLAASRGSIATIQELLDRGVSTRRSQRGNTPFMLACLHGHLEVASVLYNASPHSTNTGLNEDKENALHLAARSKNVDVIRMCLDEEMDIVLNNADESFFDIVLKEKNPETVIAILGHARWEECLDLCSTHLPHPILRIIEDIPEAFQVVLDRSASHAPLSRQHPDWWKEYCFKYITLSSPLSDSNPSTTNPPMTSPSTTNPPMTSPSTTNPPMTSPALSRRKSFAVLIHLIKYRHQNYLCHPTIASFLSCKWRHYARPYYIIRFLLFFLFTLLLSIFIGVTPPPLQTPPDTNQTDTELADGFGTASDVFRFLTIVFAIPNFVVWVIDVYVLGWDALKHLITQSDVWLHGLTLMLAFVFAVPWEGLSTLYWEVGAVAIFLAWITVTLNLQLFNLAGIVVSMLLTVTRNVFGVLLISLFIVCAFAIPLYILLATVSDFTYENIGTAVFSVLASLHGELDYRNFILLHLMGQLRFSVLTFIFLALATIIMPIVVINLLIGLAVGDIARVQREAVLSQRSIEVRALRALDQRLPEAILRRLSLEQHREYPNKSYTHKLLKIAQNMWSDFDGPVVDNEVIPTVGERTSVSMQYYNARIAALEESIATVTIQQAHQQETLTRIEEMLKKLFEKDLN